MPGHNENRGMALLPFTEAFSRSDPPQVAEVFSQDDPNTSGFNSKENHPTKILYEV
jgi:hypothetical protein